MNKFIRLSIFLFLTFVFLGINDINPASAHQNWRNDCVHVSGQWVSCGTYGSCQGPNWINNMTTCYINPDGSHSNCTTNFNEFHTANDPRCLAAPSPSPTPVCSPSYGPWNNASCGGTGISVSCSPNQRLQIRSCLNSCCNVSDLNRCVSDPTCGAPPTLTCGSLCNSSITCAGAQGGCTVCGSNGTCQPPSVSTPTSTPRPTNPPAPTPIIYPGALRVELICQPDRRVQATITGEYGPVPPYLQNTLRLSWDDGTEEGKTINYNPMPSKTVVVPNLPQNQRIHVWNVLVVNSEVFLMNSQNIRTPLCPLIPTTTLSPTATPTITPVASGTLDVTVRQLDSAGVCSAGGSPVSGVTVRLTRSGTPIGGIRTTGSTGSVAQYTGLEIGTYDLAITPSSGTVSSSVLVSPSGGYSSLFNGNINFSLSSTVPDRDVTFCMNNTASWFQTDYGDVRFPSLKNEVPAGEYGSDNPSFPGIFYSSGILTAPSDPSRVSQKEWLVDREYDYNRTASTRDGTLSYSFYKSKITQTGASLDSSLASSVNLGSLDVGAHEYTGAGNLVINTSSITGSDKRILVLSNGDVEIRGNVSVASGNLLIVAAKGNITIDEAVKNLDGYFSAEGNISIRSNAASCPTGDSQLVVNGVLVANSKFPFATGQSGKIENNRNLCSGNSSTPSLFVGSRFNFLPLMTDFYKTTYTKWEELNP